MDTQTSGTRSAKRIVWIAIASIIAMASLAGLHLLQMAREAEAERAFLQIRRAYFQVTTDAYRGFTKGGSTQDAYKVAATLEVAGSLKLGDVTTAAMKLKPDQRKLAILWTQAEGESLRASVNLWKSMGDLSAAEERRDYGKSNSLREEIGRLQTRERDAKARATHIWSQLKALLPNDADPAR